MKKIFVLCMFLVTFFTVKSQDLMILTPTGYVNDYENIFTSEQKADLEKICSDYEKKTSIEICLATSADFNLDLADNLANKWGVGKDGLDNGLMIVLSKAQRDCSIRTGYGLEGLLPDATLIGFTDDIYPRTLGQDLFYEGMKELILTCQKQMGNEGYAFKIRYKQIQEEYEAGMRTVYMYRFLYGLFALVILGCIGFLIYRQYKKRKDFLELKQVLIKLMNEIESLKNHIGNLPTQLQDIYDGRIDKLTNKLVTEDTRMKLQYIYNQLLDYKQTINSINSSIDSITKSKSDIEKYLQDNYPYCEKYLKNELNKLIPETQIESLKDGEYTKQRMNALIGIQTSIDGKLKNFLSKTVKIKNIVADNTNAKKKIEELKNSHSDYIKDKTILSSVKVGKRYSSLVNLDFDNYVSKLEQSVANSFNFLEKGDYESAVNSYGDYVTTFSVLTSAFAAVSTLLLTYNKSEKSVNLIKNNQLKSLVSDIETKINKSGVSYSHKSTYETIKTNISKFNSTLGVDVILASEMLTKIIKELDELLSSIKSDISDHESSQRSQSSPSVGSYKPSGGSGGGFSGFGGGSFGGGGARSRF